MSNFKTYDGIPAYCIEGKHVFTVNSLAKTYKCPDGHPGVPVKYLSPEFGEKYCPNCGKFKLKFTDVGVWD